MTTTLNPPFLVIRNAVAFWVGDSPTDQCKARLQAFREGCFDDAVILDARGGLWPIRNARLKRALRVWNRIATTGWVPIELELGPRQEASVSEVVSRLAGILRSDNEFCEYLPESPEALLRRFEAAQTIIDVILIAKDCDE